MTVARMTAEMPNDEYIRWQVFLGRRVQREQLEAARARAGVKR